uniref:Protein DGCR14 n=1 Tax=Hydatigena taeniaeformis TaxID=6205 RepID=A0A0R3WUW6_HYDTA
LAIEDSPHSMLQITSHSKTEQAIKQESPPSVESITSHNTVHFIPDGAPLTAQEISQHFDRERRICPANSRFKRPMAPVMDKRKLVGMGGQLKAGRFGIDGKEVAGTEGLLATPQVGGYKFMDTSASPALSVFGGAGSTPLMTWGEVDSTPYRLDEETGHTPLVSSFRLPSPSKREALAHQLADRAGRQRAKGRAEAMKLAKSGLLLSPYAAKIMLSPAAKRLLSTTTGSSSGGKLAFGGRPNSSVRATPLGLTPRRLPSDIGVVRRPPTSSVNKPSTPRRESDGGRRGLESAADLTKDLLNLSGSKSAASPTS